MTSSAIYHNITSNKLFFSGLAITGIFFSHLIGVDREHLVWSVFYPGFAGVDIFLFYSGYGLCRSLESNTLKTFYVRRLKRIYPMLAIFTLLSYLVLFTLQHEDFTPSDVICNLTTLNFWGVGGFRFEWYLSFIVYLYLLFPLLYRFVRKWGITSVIFSFVPLFIFLYFHRDGWFYQCAFSRIPIFLFGILCYQQNSSDSYKKGLLVFLPALLIMSVAFVTGIVQKFELVYMSAPFLLCLLACLSLRAAERQNAVFRSFTVLGTFSLEIYIANLLILNIMPHVQCIIPTAMTYAVAHILIVPLLVWANKQIQRL